MNTSEERIRQLEGLLRRQEEVLSEMNELVCEVDQDGRYVYISPSYYKVMGYDPDELLGKKATELIHPDDLKKALEKAAQVRDELFASVDKWRFRHKNGEWRLYSCQGRVVEREGGKQHMWVVSRNIDKEQEYKTSLLQKEIDLQQSLLRMGKKREQLEKQAKENKELLEHLDKSNLELLDRNAKLASDREKYQMLFDGMHDGAIVLRAVDNGRDFVIVDYNQAGQKMDQVNKEEIIGKSLKAEYPNVESSGFMETFRKVLHTGAPASIPKIKYADQRMNVWRENYTYRLNANEIVTIYRDITSEVLAREDLERNEKRFRALVENIDELFWLWDVDRRKLLYVSPAFNTYLNQPHFDVQNIEKWRKYVHPDDRESLNHHIEQSNKQESYSFTVRTVTEDVKTQWNLVKSFLKKEDGRTVKISISHNITQEKEFQQKQKEQNEELKTNLGKLSLANAELTKSRAALKSLFQAAPVGIGILSGESIIFANEELGSITGYTGSELLGKTLKELVQEPEEYNENFAELNTGKTNGKPLRKECNWQTKTGRHINVLVQFSAIEQNGAGSQDVTFAVLDITDQKNIEAELISAKQKAEEADNIKSAFLANMSHEVRTPVNGILGFANLLKRDKVSDEKKERFVNIIEERSRHLLKIIDDIVNISLIDAGHMKIVDEPFELNKVMDQTLEMYLANPEYENKSPALKLKAVKALPDNQSHMVSDSLRLQQILTNLLNNALKFTDEGHIHFGYEQPRGGMLRFFVKDTGIGIDEKKKALVFERFRQADDSLTRRYGGSGLGLSICKGLVSLMGGKIWMEDNPGGGSAFYFDIPYRPESSNALQFSKINLSDRPLEKKNILIVEDDPVSMVYLSEVLERTGARIFQAENGKTALLIIENEDIDLVLMDIQLPGISGYEATGLIKQKKPDIPVIAQTAHAFAEQKKKCMDAGCNNYLAKPYTEKALLDVVYRTLNFKGI